MKNLKDTLLSTSLVLLINLVFIGLGLGQIPTGYYNSANGLEETALKDALNDIIDGHTKFSYSNVWNILKETDRDPNNPNNVILLYTGWSVNGPAGYNNGNGWNREHVWAKSHGNFGTSKGPGTDVHMLRPCDISVNSARGNRYFGEGDTPYYDADGPTDCFTSGSNIWEPRDEVKGDVARIMFYMATRYEGEHGEVDLELVDYIPSNSQSSQPIHGILSVLLQWHEEDPVDDWERNRNNIIYYSYQHNRNPFIDHPEYANLIWGYPNTAGLSNKTLKNETKTVIRITDLLGREVEAKQNTTLIYFYSDGTVKKRILSE